MLDGACRFYSAYAALLSFFPFIILLITIAGIFGATDIGESVIREFYAFLPKAIVHQVSPIVDEIVASRDKGILTFSMIVILWAASSGIESLRTALNRVHKVEESRSLLNRKAQNIFFILLSVIAIMIIGGAMIVLPVWFHFIIDYCPKDLLTLCNLISIRYLIALGTVFITFLAMYRLLPNARVSAKTCLVGAGSGQPVVAWASARFFTLYTGYADVQHLIWQLSWGRNYPIILAPFCANSSVWGSAKLSPIESTEIKRNTGKITSDRCRFTVR